MAALSPTTGRLRRQREALIQWTGLDRLLTDDSLTSMRRLTEVAASTLEVERASVWLYDAGRTEICCITAYRRSLDSHAQGERLRAEAYPAFFRALEPHRAIVANDAQHDPRTRELVETYLRPHRITSILDAPIRTTDGSAGVVCHEHVGPPRRWTSDDEAFAGSMGDLASRILEAEQRRTAESERDSMFELSLDLMCVADLSGNLRRVNPAFERLLGHDPKELMKAPLLSWVHPDDRKTTAAEFERLQEGRQTTRFENRWRCADGSYRWLSWTAWSLPDRGLIYAIARDTTQRRLNEERTRLAFEAARAAAWEWNIESNETIWSKENYALLGLPEGDGSATYDDWFRCIYPEDRGYVQRQVERAVREKGGLDFEYRVVWPDGSIRWLRDVGRMVFNSGGRPSGMYGIQLDVTDHRRLEERLRRSQQMESLGRIAAAVAHDFNNVLTIIEGYGELLMERLDRGSDDWQMVKEVSGAAVRGASLTKQLLAIGRRQVLRPVNVDVNETVRKMTDLILPTLGESIRLSTHLEPELDLVWADAGQIEQALLNLVVNARDAMKEGGSLEIRTGHFELREDNFSIRSEVRPGRYVRLSVEDSGTGIEPKMLDQIFQPFFTTKPPEIGSGLGLASVQGIVQQSGGFLDVNSAPGRGSTFTIFLPVAEGELPQPSPGPSAVSETRRGGAVMVVEDDSTLRALLKTILEGEGLVVHPMENAEAACDSFAEMESSIDLLVTDLVLPGMNGAELARQLRSSNRTLPVVVMTGYRSDGSGALGRLGEESELLEKPFSPAALLAKVRSALASARPR